ncbi:MAG: hypothetical protein DI586_05240 [Micavibrio aeruginosavorus]|uniref:Calcium-binding protein n=1 Tax=Micavibrio aeruginosavorus TaxID=349221 RepID=A0A2W5HCV9_9BACT|nr:MAG: hypothetical protein DI586_05240 [Micavibrio aeruginosavorus]
MRIIIIIVITIMIAAGLYTGYGIATFETEKPAPLVFIEPDAQMLVTRGIIPADYLKTETVLTPEQKTQSDLAIAKISQAITVYQDYEKKSQPPLRHLLALLNGSIGAGQLPAYFLNVKDVLRPDRNFDVLRIDPSSITEASETNPVTCPVPGGVLIGDDTDNVINCPLTEIGGDQIFMGGPGNDTINDTLGDRIVDGGGGDDTITLGPGRSIIVLNENWGKDNVTVDCSGASVAPNEIPANFPVPWISKFTNFIVLSSRIPLESISWQGDVLTSKGGDTLTLSENCFTLVYGD